MSTSIYQQLCEKAYAISREALMLDPKKPRAAREAREQALVAINKLLATVARK
jgi:hypothetical protein